MTVSERVRQLIQENYSSSGVGTEGLKSDAQSQIDLPEEAYDMVELIMRCEEEFDIEISDEEAERCDTVDNLILCIEDKLRRKPFLPGKYGL